MTSPELISLGSPLDSPRARATLRRASTPGAHFPSPAHLAGHSLLACPFDPSRKIHSRGDQRIIKGFTLVNIRNREKAVFCLFALIRVRSHGRTRRAFSPVARASRLEAMR